MTQLGATLLIDTQGHPLSTLSKQQVVLAKTYGSGIASGEVLGREQVIIVGYNPDIDKTIENIWSNGGIQPLPSGLVDLEVVSSSAQDSVAGTGARELHLVLLDANYDRVPITVIPNGVTPVPLSGGSFTRILSASIVTAGSLGKASGNICIRGTVGGTIYCVIPATYADALSASYTVPAGRNFYLDNLVISAAASSAGHVVYIVLEATCNSLGEVTPGIFHERDFPVVVDNTIPVPYAIPLVFPEMTDIRISAVSDSGSANVSVSVRLVGYLEEVE